MDITDLQKIGLTEGEIKIYKALLKLGETTRTELAKTSGISPSKVYDVANRLLEKGVISSIKKQGVLHFSPASPERLKDFLKNKEEEIKKETKIVDQLLPKLLAQYKTTKDKTDIEVFYGWEGMKTVFQELRNSLGKGDINYIFGASKGLDPQQADIFFSRHYKQIDKKGYKVNIIFNENVRGNTKRTGYYTKNKKHNVKYLHQDTFTELNLYKDTVLFVMLLQQPIVMRVTNKEAAQSFKTFFQTLWKQAKN